MAWVVLSTSALCYLTYASRSAFAADISLLRVVASAFMRWSSIGVIFPAEISTAVGVPDGMEDGWGGYFES